MTPLILICATLVFHDGDSGSCRAEDGTRHAVRLAGMDAGEIAPFTRCRNSPRIWACTQQGRSLGLQAGVRARQLGFFGARCTVSSTDRYRRNVVVCTVAGEDIGATLVREGLARSVKAYGDPYRDEEREARRAKRGIWA